MKCTWEECRRRAEHEEKANNGSVWARLCQAHHEELKKAIARSLDEDGKLPMMPRLLLRAWVKAQGGSRKAAKRLSGW
jgi:hypothetical protein